MYMADTRSKNKIRAKYSEAPQQQGDRLLLKAGEVAHRLNFAKSTAYQMMESGEIETVRRGKSVRVPAWALDKWIEANLQNTG